MSSDSDPVRDTGSETPPRGERQDGDSGHGKDAFGRLHATSILFDVASHFRTLVVPTFIAVFSAAKGNTGWLILGLVLIVPTVISSIVRYFTLRFRIRDGELVVTEGILTRRVRTVPVERIQNVNLVQNLLHRVAGVAEVRVETASGTEPEATLRVVSMAQVHALRDAIFESRTSTPVQHGDDSAEGDETVRDETEDSELLRIPTAWLCRAGLASNRGMVLIGVVIWVFTQFDLNERFRLDEVIGSVESNAGGYFVSLFVIGGILFVLVLLRLLSMAWYVLRFHDYRLTRAGDDLRIACGLFTKVSASVPRRRIQFISIHQNFWMKLMGISSIRIETAGGAGTGTEDAASSVSSRWFIPVVTDDKVAGLVNQLREGLAWGQGELDWRPLSPRTTKRLTRIAAMQCALMGLAGLWILRPWLLLFALVASIPMILYAFKKSRAMRYARTDYGVVYRSGLFTKKISLTFFDRIQALRIEQSPFDRRWRMAKLSVDTAASGPAEHTIRIPYLAEECAEREYREILQQASAN